jgi:tetratricopeptide (TPR) repeat protein
MYLESVLLKGQLLTETLAFEDALELYEGYLTAYPNGAMAQGVHLLAALCYEGMGDFDRAKAYLGKAIELEPGSPIADEAKLILESL